MTGKRTFMALGLVLAALMFVCGGCSDDVELLPVGQARLVSYSHSEECVAQGDPLGLEPGDAEVEVRVNGLEVTVFHKNALLNCCLDSILVSFEQDGKLLKLSETEELTTPCDCICPFEVVATLEVTMPGRYIVEVWTGNSPVWTGDVKVEGQ